VSEGVDAVLLLLGRLPMPAVICDTATGEILWINSRDLHLVGATAPDQIIGRNLLQFLDTEQHGIALRDIEAIGRGEVPAPVTYKVSRIDGGSAYLQIASVPMRWGEGTAMLSLLSDQTQQMQAMRDLAESEERYRALVETSPAGIVVVAHGSEIVYVNAALAAALGATPAQLLGRSMYDFVAPEFRKPIREARRRILLTGQLMPASPATLVRLDGERIDVTAASTLVAWHGEQATQTVVRELETGVSGIVPESDSPHEDQRAGMGLEASD